MRKHLLLIGCLACLSAAPAFAADGPAAERKTYENPDGSLSATDAVPTLFGRREARHREHMGYLAKIYAEQRVTNTYLSVIVNGQQAQVALQAQQGEVLRQLPATGPRDPALVPQLPATGPVDPSAVPQLPATGPGNPATLPQLPATGPALNAATYRTAARSSPATVRRPAQVFYTYRLR